MPNWCNGKIPGNKVNVHAFNVVPEVSLQLSSFLFILYPIFCSEAVISTILSSMSFTHASASVILLWIPVSVLFISLCLFFSSCSVQFSCSVVSDSLQPHGLQNARLPCPLPTPGTCSNSCPLSQ